MLMCQKLSLVKSIEPLNGSPAIKMHENLSTMIKSKTLLI